MSALSVTELSPADRPNVADIFAARSRSKAIREEVEGYCHSQGLLRDQTKACVDTAILARDAIAGKKAADRIVAKMKAIKARYWPRDPEPPQAA